MCFIGEHACILSECRLITSVAALAMGVILLQNFSELMNLLPVLSSHVSLLYLHLWGVSILLVFGLWVMW